MNTLFGLENECVVMTGASGGVGAATARLFATQAGAKVALLSRRGCPELAQEINDTGGNAQSYCADVSKRDDLEKVFDDIAKNFGKIKSLINISGTCEFYSPDDSALVRTKVDEDRWQKIVDVNCKGVAYAVELAAEIMKEDGSIVNVGSTAGRFGAELAVFDYSFSKAGLIGLTMAYAKILSTLKIRVNAVAPGPIEGTDMLSQASLENVNKLKASTKLGKLCRPEDIAAINLFLASDMSSVMTGETIDANCGQYICY